MTDKVRKGLAFCIPSTGNPVPKSWAFALRFLDPPINLYSVYYSPEGLPVDEARNDCVEFARKQNCKYLFFMDEDTVPPPETIRKFVFYMENNPGIDVIAGVYCSKCMPPAPLVFRGNGSGSYWDWKVGEFFWVTGIGMGCTLIRMSVFDRIEKPYYLTIKADGHIDAVPRAEAWTEDLYFTEKVLKSYGWESSNDALDKEKVKRLPKPVWCDGAIICDHFDVKTGKVFTLPPNSGPSIRRVAVGDKKILDLGCGEVATILKDGTPVRVDMRDDVLADYRCDARVLPFKTESFDVVFSSHLLEHFDQLKVGEILDEWLRVLSVGGELRLIVPDLGKAADLLKENPLHADAWKILYGGQSAQWDFHKTGFTKESLKALLEQKGLEIVKIWAEEPFNLFAEAKKVKGLDSVGMGQGRAILKADLNPVLAADSFKGEVKATDTAGPVEVGLKDRIENGKTLEVST